MSIEDDIRRVVREELLTVVADLRSVLTAATSSSAPGQLEALLTVEQAATYCGGVEPDTVREWIHRDGLVARRPGRSRTYLIRRSDLERFLDGQRAQRGVIDDDQHLQLMHQRVKRAAGSR